MPATCAFSIAITMAGTIVTPGSVCRTWLS
jgi:hypothetical protein